MRTTLSKSAKESRRAYMRAIQYIPPRPYAYNGKDEDEYGLIEIWDIVELAKLYEPSGVRPGADITLDVRPGYASALATPAEQNDAALIPDWQQIIEDEFIEAYNRERKFKVSMRESNSQTPRSLNTRAARIQTRRRRARALKRGIEYATF